MDAALDYPRPFGKYVLLRPLATGGMAEVFLAQMRGHASFDKACVVKRVLPGHVANKRFMEMFLDEACVIARLSHPNVVQVFDMGQVDNDFFMAMEYVPGADMQIVLEALPEAERRVPVPVACRIIAQVAEGLDHAHRAVDGAGAGLGIVHRDVSPSNIIVSVDGVAKICDFGIAKSGSQVTKTEVGSLKGKIHYMSPEQVRGDKLDGRSDLFSLGSVLYEMTLGERPFDGGGPAEIAIKILQEEPRSPDSFVDGFPRELWAVIQCLLAKKPSDRFGSARELQVALDELLVAWHVRASSNEVASYLESALPGIGERARESSALAARSVPERRAPIERRNLAVQPTAEMPAFGDMHADLQMGDALVSPIPLELSGQALGSDIDDRGRNRKQSSSKGTFVVAFIVVAVGGGFYWLTQRADHQAQVAAQPVPAAKIDPAPVVTALPAAAQPKPEVHDVKVESPKPDVKPDPPEVKAEARKPEKHRSHGHDKGGDDGAHALPRLPSPPPAADEESE